MRRIGVCCTTLIMCCALSGIYGILHDQLLYSLSPEYFIQYKFPLYGINPAEYGGDRMAVALAGFLGSWWYGILIGLPVGLTALLFSDFRMMKTAVILSVMVVLGVTIAMGITGYLLGDQIFIDTGSGYSLAKNISDPVSYNVAFIVHRFTKVGVALGVILSVSFLLAQKARANLIQVKFAV